MKRRPVRAALGRFLVVLAALTVAACGGEPRWWMFQTDLRHTGHNPGLSSRSPHTLRWAVPLVTGTIQLTPPVFGRSKILIGSWPGDGRLYALWPDNGSVLWSFAAPAGNGFQGAAAAVGDRVYAATFGPSPHVYALNEGTGAVVWQTPLPAGSIASIAVADGRVFVNTDQHRLYAFAAATGALVWSAFTSPGVSAQGSSPAVGSGRVFVGSDDGLFAFDAVTGAQSWKFPLASPPSWSSPVLHVPPTGAPLVYISTVGRPGVSPTLHAVNATTGAPAWSYVGAGLLGAHTSALANGRLFIVDYVTLKALDAVTGRSIWAYTPTGAASTPVGALAAGDELVYYSDVELIRGVDMATGTLVWQAPIPGNGHPNAPGNSPGIEFELLVVPNKGYVYAFR